MSVISFKQRVLNTIISCAADYKSVYLAYDYLIYSDKFQKNQYYTINAKEGNYKHLTGVNSTATPFDFFEMCLNGSLTEDDFDFIKPEESEKLVRGVVRNKIMALPSMADLFNNDLIAEENFSHGRVNCMLATADNNITVGFEDRIDARLKTLLRGNEIDKSKAVDVTLILRKSKESNKFDTVLQGNIDENGYKILNDLSHLTIKNI
jgi:hypothetical protein